MLQNEIIERIKERYEKRYSVTLAPTDENIKQALRVSFYGIMKGLGIRQTVESYYGYRNRRMENFLKECGLWTIREGWSAWDVEVKVYTHWVTITEKGLEDLSAETSYIIPVPPAMIYFKNEVDEKFLTDLHYACLEAINFSMPLMKIDVGIEMLESETTWDWEKWTKVNIDVSVTVSSLRTSKAYSGKVKALITNFSPFITFIAPSFEILEVETFRVY